MSIDPDHFLLSEDGLATQPWMQMRRVAYGYATGTTRRYAAVDSSSTNKNDFVHSVTAKWVNDSPIDQYVYGMVTRGGTQVSLQARSRGYLLTRHGQLVNGGTDDPVTMVDVSKVGCGLDMGKAGILAVGIAYGINEIRQNSTTVPLMPQLPGWTILHPGETFTAQVEVRFISEFWENTAIDGGTPSTESRVTSGDTRVDLFALPAIGAVPMSRLIPQVISESHAALVSLGNPVVVPVPTGIHAGDVLIAVACSQFGQANAITAPAGWTRKFGAGMTLINDVHMVVFYKIATDNEPNSYSFGTAFLAEGFVSVMAVRDASPVPSEWSFGARLAQPWFWETGSTEQIVPAIPDDGELLIAASYAAFNSPITQTTPSELTEITEWVGDHSMYSSGSMTDPGNPTPELTFLASDAPNWPPGHSITAGLLLPGRWA